MEKAPTKTPSPNDTPGILLFCLGFHKALGPLIHYRPSVLLHIGDKPIVSHVLDFLADQGFKEVEAVLHHFPEQVEDYLQDGSRWGLRIRYHLAKQTDRPFAPLIPLLQKVRKNRWLICQGDVLPHFASDGSKDPGPRHFQDPGGAWTGWSWVQDADIQKVTSSTALIELSVLTQAAQDTRAAPFLDARSIQALQESNIKILQSPSVSIHLPTALKHIEPGVWISRAVVIEPGATLIPPVMIGENSYIKSGAILGPNAVIENHCMVDNEARIEDSLVCQNSYVGENLEIRHCVIDRNALMNLAQKTEINLVEDFLLSEMQPAKHSGAVQSILERLTALLFFIASAPVLLVLSWIYPLKKEAKLSLPALACTSSSKTFLLYSFDIPSLDVTAYYFKWLPALWNVVRGDLAFVGNPPRNLQEFEALPKEWGRLYSQAKPGLISFAEIAHGTELSEDEHYAAEAFYAVRKSFVLDIQVIGKWVLKKFPVESFFSKISHLGDSINFK